MSAPERPRSVSEWLFCSSTAGAVGLPRLRWPADRQHFWGRCTEAGDGPLWGWGTELSAGGR